jgi:signal transduction histidine kinase
VRRRLTVLVLAVTSLVVIAFTVPLGLLVRQQADSRARTNAERVVQEVTAGVVREVVSAAGSVEPGILAARVALPSTVSLLLPDGTVLGEGAPDKSEVATRAVALSGSVNDYTDLGWELAVPVITRSGTVIVWTLVPETELRQGVADAQLLLGLLGVGLIVISLGVAARLGRTLTQPVAELAEAARSLAGGDLSTRVTVKDPPEFAVVADAFNQMAPRLQELIDIEREEVADLSHRLRTPLTSVRLQAESISDQVQRAAVLAQIDRLQQAVDQLIAEARRRPQGGAPSADVNAVLRRRIAFWSVLADEQRRDVGVSLADGRLPVGVSEGELGAALDALIGNVFSHTDPGVGFRISTAIVGDRMSIVVEDDGPGFPDDFDPLERGQSGGGSSGLGLDIVRRLAERLGGEIRLEPAAGGGARVVVALPRNEPGVVAPARAARP